jgi:hypothetical protein
MSDNPFEAPGMETGLEVLEPGSRSEAERIRRAHFWMERTIRVTSILYAVAAAGLLWLAVELRLMNPEAYLYLPLLCAATGIACAWCFHALWYRAGWAQWPVLVAAALGLLLSPLLIPLNGFALFLVFSTKGKVVLSPQYVQIIRKTPQVQSSGIVGRVLLAAGLAVLLMAAAGLIGIWITFLAFP